MADLSEEDRGWLFGLLRKRAEAAKGDARKLRTTNPRRQSRRALDVLADAHEQAAKAYERAIEYHCADERRAELLRRIDDV